MPKKLFHLAAFLFCCVACRRGDGSDAVTHERVRQVAQEYYGYLMAGQYEEYVAHMADVDSMSDDMRQQLVVMVKEFAHIQQHLHGGFASATVVADSLPDSLHAQAFLDVLFADSTQERVGLPLRYQGGRWRLE